jgi:glycosyltransferase involved in cell wall biosynthesis
VTNPVLFDVTALVADPYRSGIQRVQREVLRHWPDDEGLAPCSMSPSGVIRLLPPSIRDILCRDEDGPNDTFESDQRALATLTANAPALPGGKPRHVLNLELFYEGWRADLYRSMCASGWRVQWLLYDFLPWLCPTLFKFGAPKHFMFYLRALRMVPEVAFISDQTKNEYRHRIMRDPGKSGPVLPLGADALHLERQTWSPDRRNIVVIGSVERRKNSLIIAEAFRLLWSQGVDARLVFAGRIEDTHAEALRQLRVEAGPQRLMILDHPSDSDIRAVLGTARAVLLASELEGFGLPPYEALNSGIPSITVDSLPSIRRLPPIGQIRLPKISPRELADAINSMMNDQIAERLWAEAAQLKLPTWRDFAHAVAAWAKVHPPKL